MCCDRICTEQGTSKSGLMGFCDCAPGETKVLRVLFLFNKEPHMAILSDQVYSDRLHQLPKGKIDLHNHSLHTSLEH